MSSLYRKSCSRIDNNTAFTFSEIREKQIHLVWGHLNETFVHFPLARVYNGRVMPALVTHEMQVVHKAMKHGIVASHWSNVYFPKISVSFVCSDASWDRTKLRKRENHRQQRVVENGENTTSPINNPQELTTSSVRAYICMHTTCYQNGGEEGTQW